MSDWDIVTVCQVGSSNTVFRTSEEYVYLNGRAVPYTDELKAEKILLNHGGDAAKAAAEIRELQRAEKRSQNGAK